MNPKWSLGTSLFYIAAAQGLICRTSAAVPSTLAFGMAPSGPPGGRKPGGLQQSNENDDADVARQLLSRLRADAVGIWSVQIRSGATADETLETNPSLFEAASRGGVRAEDPWSSFGQPTERRKRGGSRGSDGENAAAAAAECGLDESTILLNLRKDGSFRQCNEGYTEGRWLKGRWSVVVDLEDRTKVTTVNGACQSRADRSWMPRLYLAMDRQYYGPPVDTLYDGSFLTPNPDIVQPNIADWNSADDGTANQLHTPAMQVTGRVRTGRFALPKTDPTFFERALEGTLLVERRANEAASSDRDQAMTFVLTQLVSSRSLAGKTQSATASPTAWSKDDDGNAFQFRAMPRLGLICHPRYAT